MKTVLTHFTINVAFCDNKTVFNNRTVYDFVFCNNYYNCNNQCSLVLCPKGEVYFCLSL